MVIRKQTAAPGNNVTFTVVASGSANLFYQWYFNTNTLVASATNGALTLANIQSTNAGIYSVVITSSAGSVTSTNAFLTVSAGIYSKPQISGLVFSNGIFSLTISGDSGPDYIVQGSTNLTTWNNLFTNHSPNPPFNWSDTAATNFTQRFYRIQITP